MAEIYGAVIGDIVGSYHEVLEKWTVFKTAIKQESLGYITEEYRNILDSFNNKFVIGRNNYAEEDNGIW